MSFHNDGKPKVKEKSGVDIDVIDLTKENGKFFFIFF